MINAGTHLFILGGLRGHTLRLSQTIVVLDGQPAYTPARGQGNSGVSQEIAQLQAALRAFAQARDWEQFHSPKNLAASLSIEAAEVLEHFQWLTDEQSRQLDPARKAEVADEIADVLLYLLQLADKLGIDPLAAARDKLARNAERYPVERAKGSSAKYTDL